MSSFDDLLAADAGFFVDPDNGGETVEYTPPGGVASDIDISIVRGALRVTDEASKIFTMKLDIEAINSATDGIDSAACVGGILKIAPRRGQTPVSITIRQENIVGHDAGMIRLSF
jgi:hypothetical protein